MNLENSPITSAERPFVNLGSFVQAVYQKQPDFQRPAGDYDSWFIRDQESGLFLRGFENWERVDGAFIRFMICGPLHWLGITDLAAAAENPSKPVAFRFSTGANDLLAGKVFPESMQEVEHWIVRSDGRIKAARCSARPARYQLARFCAWERPEADFFYYRISPASLVRARKQGLRISQLINLLRKQAQSVPPSLVRALERWEDQGKEAHFEHAVILRVRNPEIIQLLRASRAARFLGDPLSSTTIIINPGAEEAVKNVLAELGYLSEVNLEGEL